MIYACDACRFLFERITEPERCPDCGKFNIRPAAEDEITEYRNRRFENELICNNEDNKIVCARIGRQNKDGEKMPKQFKIARKMNKLKLTEAAEKLGVVPPTLSSWDSGRK